MRLIRLHRLVPTTGDVKETEVIINLDKVAYFYPTLDDKHTIFRFESDNEFLQVSEKYSEVTDYLQSVVEWER